MRNKFVMKVALSGMFTEVLDIMAPIDTATLEKRTIPSYYHIYDTVYGGLEASSADPVLSLEYKQKKDRYRAGLLRTLGENDISRIYVETEIMRDEGLGTEILDRLEPLTASDTLTSHQKGILYYISAKACQICGDREKAIAFAMDKLEKGDVLLVAGKGHETGQYINGKVLPFNDEEVVKKYL